MIKARPAAGRCCSICAKPLVKVSWDRPACRTCEPAARRRDSRRRRAERDLRIASFGTRGKRAWVQGPCNWCGDAFSPARSTHTRFCSERCKSKAIQNRRIGRESSGGGEWRWSDFMRMARGFNYCCAYCGDKPERLDPDHVVPLSSGGPNTLSNLLPVCLACNSDKRDLDLADWNADRVRRDLLPRITSWPVDDSRYFHLTSLIGERHAA